MLTYLNVILKSDLFILIGGKLLYNIVVVFAIHRHGSAPSAACDFLKQCGLNLLIHIVFLNACSVFNIFLRTSSRTFLEGRCFLLTAHRPWEY